MNALQLEIHSSSPIHRQFRSYSHRATTSRLSATVVRVGAVTKNKPSICTADELHYVSVPGSDWRLALWRYLPLPDAPRRNHPLLLLAGVGNNAIGYDLSPPRASFSRYMASEGFDTWILEVRGAGLSMKGLENMENDHLAKYISKNTVEGLLETWLRSNIGVEMKGLSQKLFNDIEGWQSVPPTLTEFRERFSGSFEEIRKQLDLLFTSDWDLEEYLKTDVPVVMDYIRSVSEPEDGKLLAIGHSMGGIALYALLSLSGFKGQEPGLAAVTTLGSSLDFTPSKSSFRIILPALEPLQALSVPAFPVGAVMAAIHPLTSTSPLSWLSSQITAQGLIVPELVERLVLKNFCTIPVKLLSQLATLFQKGGLRDRSRSFIYKNHLHKSKVPVLAIAGDQDMLCPPEAVYETVKVIPEHLITYKVFGEPGGPHYAHYDIVGGRMAPIQVYPEIIKFLSDHDKI